VVTKDNINKAEILLVEGEATLHPEVSYHAKCIYLSLFLVLQLSLYNVMKRIAQPVFKIGQVMGAVLGDYLILV
jgi:hypothetical protein